jgi:hypothetical protein
MLFLQSNQKAMNGISIEGTVKTPTVSFNEKKGTLFIGGRSLPEHPTKFYDVVYNWLNSYFNQTNPSPLEVVVMLEYCNTTSSKVILDLFTRLGKIIPNSNACQLKWYYETDDADTKDVAEIIMSEKILSVEIIGVSKFDFTPHIHA